jgi:adenylosuccinate lyase
MEGWKSGAGFQDLVGKDPFIARYLNQAEIKACFDPRYYLRHLDKIYGRVFGRGSIRRARPRKRRHRTGRT